MRLDGNMRLPALFGLCGDSAGDPCKPCPAFDFERDSVHTRRIRWKPEIAYMQYRRGVRLPLVVSQRVGCITKPRANEPAANATAGGTNNPSGRNQWAEDEGSGHATNSSMTKRGRNPDDFTMRRLLRDKPELAKEVIAVAAAVGVSHMTVARFSQSDKNVTPTQGVDNKEENPPTSDGSSQVTEKVEESCATLRRLDQAEARPRGGDRKSAAYKEINVDNINNDIAAPQRPDGTSAAATMRRLAKDRPD